MTYMDNVFFSIEMTILSFRMREQGYTRFDLSYDFLMTSDEEIWAEH